VGGITGAALLLALAHGMTDAYMGFLSPLLPRIMDRMGLTIGAAAVISTVLALSSSLLQPLMGHLSDRYGRRLFLAAGPLSGVFLALMGVAPSVVFLVVLLILGGVMSAAFHPPGATVAARASAGKGSGARFSVFSFGGAAGYALGPLVAVWLVSRGGFQGLWVAMIPGIVLALLLLRLPDVEPPQRRAPDIRGILKAFRGPLGIIFGLSAVGAFAQRLFLTMEPIVVAQAGGSEAAGAVAVSVYLAAQAGGTLAGGAMADRMDRRTLLILLTLVNLPAHLLAFALPPGTPGFYLAVLVAGGVNMALLPPIIVMAQELLPGSAGASSGIVMGLAWSVGSLLIPVAGILGDVVGAREASLFSMPVLALGCFLAFHPVLRQMARPA
jgi:MFS transporter, FSR family, fosmidomycin resistance protein